MISRYAIFFALIFFLGGCVKKIDPKKADEEVRKLLVDVPGFEWEPSGE